MPRLITRPLPNHANLVWRIYDATETEPITTAEVKAWGKIDTDAEDTVIESLIIAVRQAAEAWLGRTLIEQTIISHIDYWPSEPLKLPRPPLISVTSISLLTEEGVSSVYSSNNYYVRTDIEPGEVVIKNGCVPPVNTDRYHGGIKILHVNGYSDDASELDQLLKQGLIEWVLFAIESRIVSREPPDNAAALLTRYKMPRI